MATTAADGTSDGTSDGTATAAVPLRSGDVHIKAEFLRVTPSTRTGPRATAAAAATAAAPTGHADDEAPVAQPAAKRLKGQNKQRPYTIVKDEAQLCLATARGAVCAYGERCRYNHDVERYLASKPPDLGERCFIFDQHGRCPYGFSCRFARAHMTSDLRLVTREDAASTVSVNAAVAEDSLNHLTMDTQKRLQRRTYPFLKSEQACKDLGLQWTYKASQNHQKATNKRAQLDEADGNTLADSDGTEEPAATTDDPPDDHVVAATVPAETELNVSGPPDVPLRPNERKQIDFKGKLYLAPLTTVGNLPFRRVCKRLGVDITCGEMAVAQNIVMGVKNEWALLRRHECEDVFGVQIAGGFADSMMRCAEIINNHVDCDFVDINLGCPIDIAVKSGYGSVLLQREKRLKQIVSGVLKVLDKPLTVKLRTGFSDDHQIAHSLLPQLRDMGVSAATLHGRSKQQHYYHTADWNYIQKCADATSPLPLFGNGDLMSYNDYERVANNSQLAGVMLARGALIKPWVFTEIKERRIWDISASERLDILRDFCNYGLEHWGSDTTGVNKTRRFLLEWQSFLYRYVPVGVLERIPQRMNDRVPSFVGRNDLETLMASPMSSDWIKISEMLLGKTPSDFVFQPKHKANTSELTMAQG